MGYCNAVLVKNIGKDYNVVLRMEKVVSIEKKVTSSKNAEVETIFDNGNLALITGSANPDLARSLANILATQLDEPIGHFADRETRVQIGHNLRRKHTILIQPTSPPANDHIMELFFMIDAAQRASATEVTAVMPYFGYSRQDRKEQSRVPISSATVVRCLAGLKVNRIMTLDIHSEQQQGFFFGPWDNLYASYTLIPELRSFGLINPVFVSPDIGGVKRAKRDAELMGSTDIGIVYKERDIHLENESNALFALGDFTGRDIVFTDDLIDTAGTLTNAANLVSQNGARRIIAMATHGLFTGPALERIANSPIEAVLITDSIRPSEEVKNHQKIRIVSIAPLLAEAIRLNQTGESISGTLFHL